MTNIYKMCPTLCVVVFTIILPVELKAATITGTVRDSATHEALSDVIVRIKGTHSVLFTDALGQFQLVNVQSGNVKLTFDRLGYSSREISVVATEEFPPQLTIELSQGNIQLTTVPVTGTRDISQSLSTINRVDKVLRPTNSAQDLLRLVPGLFIAQHAGGGKAEQIFLRGFDVDHGTDFAVSIDGLPVNMVSHAHGQGYADFHFVIPETVDKLNVSKGLYSARQGDFSTAGSGEFFTKNRMETNLVRLEYGRFDTWRAVGVFRMPGNKFLTGNNEHAYVAAEYNFTNSYFESPQHFNRFNVFGKYTTGLGLHNTLTLSASTFGSRWDASGQIPDRAVDSELITRFGSIDNTEGGATSRSNINAILLSGLRNGAVIRNQVYYSHYEFDLFSNFTFFLKDSINGDGIRQTDSRNIFGYHSTYDHTKYFEHSALRSILGAGIRSDLADIALMKAVRRTVYDTTAMGKLNQQNIYLYAEETFTFSPKFAVNAGVRYDVFVFAYDNYLADINEGRAVRSRVSPKLSVFFTPNDHLQLYAKSGIGFHSNDARSVVSGEAGNGLPRAYGYEAGSTFRLFSKLLVNVSLWGLDLENELVYVGDEGIVEISGATRRVGVDFSARMEITKFIFADIDFNYNHGRYRYLPKGENYIPLAPAMTSTGGISLVDYKGFNASLRYRYIDTRPANENNTVQAQGYFLLDAVVNYSVRRLTFGVTGENLLNAEWNEAQFDTESKLRGETTAVSELHYTPGSPFFLKASITATF